MKVVEFLSYLKGLDIKLWAEEEKLRYQAPKGAMTTEIKAAIAAQKTEILDFLKAAQIPTNTVELEIISVSRDQDLPPSLLLNSDSGFYTNFPPIVIPRICWKLYGYKELSICLL